VEKPLSKWTLARLRRKQKRDQTASVSHYMVGFNTAMVLSFNSNYCPEQRVSNS
jgi:hypothetical protein